MYWSQVRVLAGPPIYLFTNSSNLAIRTLISLLFELKIDWRIYTKNPDNPLIRDLIIEGLSLARTQKEEFASILSSNDGDINALYEALEKFANN